MSRRLKWVVFNLLAIFSILKIQFRRMSDKSNSITPISEIGEFGLIAEIAQYARKKNESTIIGIGDDAAVLNFENQHTVISTDFLMEGIHFDLVYTSLTHLGYKSVAVNISDICAMMATPSQVTVSIAVSGKFSVEAIKAFYEGVEKACDFYNVDLVGGDTTSSLTGMAINVTAIGSVEKDKAVLRHKAQIGDLICVSGDLGGAYIGLQIMEREKQIFMENKDIQPELEKHQYVLSRLLKPEARLDIVEQLRDAGIQPTSMIDISDGLSSDLLHICTQSQVGCEVFSENIPIHNDTLKQAIEFNIDPVSTALNGGEDYELLFTVPSNRLHEIELLNDIRIIGKITEQGNVLKTQSGNSHDITAMGWESFNKA